MSLKENKRQTTAKTPSLTAERHINRFIFQQRAQKQTIALVPFQTERAWWVSGVS